MQENLGKLRQSITAVLNAVLGGDWKYMSRNPVSSVREEEGWWRAWGADGQHKGLGHACATWCEEEQGKDAVKGRGHWARGVDWCTPVILLPFASRLVIHRQISRNLEREVGFSKITHASGVAELRSGREAGGPSWRSSGQQLATGCRVPGEPSTWVHMQSGLINSAAHGATCSN